MKFLDLVIRGGVTEQDFEDYVEAWHEGDSDEPLHEFLGLTREEYASIVERGLPLALPPIYTQRFAEARAFSERLLEAAKEVG